METRTTADKDMGKETTTMENDPEDNNNNNNSTTLGCFNQDMLEEILRKSSTCNGGILGSRIRFGRVCSSWRSVAAANPYKPVLPWLMLSKLDSSQETRSFLSLEEKRIHEINFPAEDVNSSWCCGSSEGWLVMSHPTSGNFLYNPITRDRVNLPWHYNAPGKAYLDEKKIRPEKPLYISKAIVITSSSLAASYSSSQHNGRRPLHDDPTKIDTSIKIEPIIQPIFETGIEELTDLHLYPDSPIRYSLDYYPDIVLVVAIFAQNNFVGICRPIQPGVGLDYNWSVIHTYPDCIVEYASQTHADNSVDDYESEEHHHVVQERLKWPTFTDVILYRGALYLVTHGTAMLGVIQFNTIEEEKVVRFTSNITWLKMLPQKFRRSSNDWNYLVESSSTGELLMVVRIRRGPCPDTDINGCLQTSDFLVFKLDESSDPMKWIRIESLGDQILFLGNNHSKSISASDIPAGSSTNSATTCRSLSGNCIYFTKDFCWRHVWLRSSLKNPGRPFLCNEVGVFYLQDKEIETSFSVINNNNKTNNGSADHGHEQEMMMKFPNSLVYPAIFIMPNLSSYSRGRLVSFLGSPLFILYNLAALGIIMISRAKASSQD